MLKRPSVTTTMAPNDLIMLSDFSEPIVYPAMADRLGLLGPLAVDVSTLYANVERLTFSARIVASAHSSFRTCASCGFVRADVSSVSAAAERNSDQRRRCQA